MRINKFTISQTIQVKQFEPLNLVVEFDLESSDDPKKVIAEAHRFVHNTLRAEYYRQLPAVTSVDVATAQKHQVFIERHANTDYFAKDEPKGLEKTAVEVSKFVMPHCNECGNFENDHTLDCSKACPF